MVSVDNVFSTYLVMVSETGEVFLLRCMLCENYHGQSCKAFISLTVGAKMIGGG